MSKPDEYVLDYTGRHLPSSIDNKAWDAAIAGAVGLIIGEVDSMDLKLPGGEAGQYIQLLPGKALRGKAEPTRKPIEQGGEASKADIIACKTRPPSALREYFDYWRVRGQGDDTLAGSTTPTSFVPIKLRSKSLFFSHQLQF